LTAKGSGSTLGIDNTFGEVRPSLGRRRGPRVSALKDNVIAKPGPSPPGSSPRIRPEQAARPVTPEPRLAVPQGHQPGQRPWQVNSGVGPTNGRPSQAPTDLVFFSSRLCLCSRWHRYPWPRLIEERPRVFLLLSKGSLGQQGRTSRGTPTPPGYGYLTRHLYTGRLTLGEAVQATNRRVLVLENEEKTRLSAEITYMFRPRQPQ
jgi:hypothetical protein